MTRLMKLAKECMNELDAIGIKYASKIEINSKLKGKSYWGYCTENPDGSYTIRINEALLNNANSDVAVKNTIMHELLHTIKGGMCHTGAWKKAAECVNKTYSFYNIKRCNSAEEKGVAPLKAARKELVNKYELICNSCGHHFTYKKLTNVVKLAKSGSRRITCPCGGHVFTVIDL